MALIVQDHASTKRQCFAQSDAGADAGQRERVRVSILVPPSFTRRSETRWALFRALCPPVLNHAIALLPALRRGLITPQNRFLMQFFVIIGTQRTGSTVLREVLNSNTELAVAGEIFDGGPESFDAYLVKQGLGRPTGYPDAERQIVEFLGAVNAERPAAAKVFGCDIKYCHIRAVAPSSEPLCALPALLQFIRLSGVRVIHLVRENVLQSALSELIAETRAVWHHTGDEQIERRIKIDCRKLIQYMQVKRADRQIFSSVMEGHGRMVTCDYDRFVSGIAMTDADGNLTGEHNPLFELADFLGVERRFKAPRHLKKIVQKNYAELIENYDEVRKIVRRTEFVTYLETI
jgi:LPS sulfotransferase NodH